ncbi:hypothetical protein BI330_03640 [Mycobacterium sp. CBMA 623]|nr:hypothetical protein [Mycobacteroides sp. CBMA 326]
MCTVEGQHWALVLPVVAFVAAAVVAFVSPICVAAFKWYPALIWIGVPLTIGAYVVAPKVANWGRLQEIW